MTAQPAPTRDPDCGTAQGQVHSIPITVLPARSPLSQGGVRTMRRSSGTGVIEHPLTTRARAIWTAGDFDRVSRGHREGAADFIGRLNLQPGERVLDVACGSGNLALPAAATGARVTGLDIAPNLLATGRRHATALGLDIRFDEGDAEALPYPDGSFDTAVSMFGAMFAPHPELAAAELLRVVRPGGRIAMANWTSAGLIGTMLRLQATLVPPPPGLVSPMLWGDEDEVRRRLGLGIARFELTRRTISLSYPHSPEGTVELFRGFYGPTIQSFAGLEPDARAGLHRLLTEFYAEHNQATDGTTRIEAEYLEVVAVRT
jgi:SAM-dependent methyltransferase